MMYKFIVPGVLTFALVAGIIPYAQAKGGRLLRDDDQKCFVEGKNCKDQQTATPPGTGQQTATPPQPASSTQKPANPQGNSNPPK